LILFFCFYSVICFMPLFGQGGVEMTKPHLMIVNDTLIIRYGFVGSKPWDVFNVRLEITDSAGKAIPARSFSGDIGDSIYGGQQKIILWNMAADNIFISQQIFVEVISEKLDAIEIPVAGPLRSDSLVGQQADYGEPKMIKPGNEREETTTSYKKNNVLLSAFVPGWGLTRLSNGKPYWLIGVAGFGCIGTSVYLNRQAAANLDSYKKSIVMEESSDYFSTAEQQYLTSNILGCTAIAIWVIDLGITVLRVQRIRNSISGRNLSRLSVGSGYQSNTNTTFLTMNYRF